MAHHIKSPGSKAAEGVANQGQAGQAPKTGGAGFREALQKVAASSAGGPSQVQAAQGAQAIAADLRAGRIDSVRAVEMLVTQRLQSPSAQALTPAGRAALEAHLRSKLTTDPTLLAFIAELENSEKRG